MSGKTHAIIGANIGWIFVPWYGFVIAPSVIGLAILGALLTDIDAAESKIKYLSFGYGRGKNRVRIQPFYVPATAAAAMFKHRGFWHSLLANVLVALIVLFGAWYVNEYYFPLTVAHALALPLGYLSHILIDSLTKYGVPFFWPLKKNFHLLPQSLRLKTNSYGDNILFALGLMFFAFFIMKLLEFRSVGL